MYMDNKEKLGFPYALLMVFLGVPIISGTNRQYIAIFVVTFLIVAFNFTYKIRLRSSIEKLPLWFLFFWVYGIGIGILRGNNTSDIFQNFAGMSVYVLCIVLLNTKRFRIRSLYKAIYYASIIVCFEVIIVYLFRIRRMTPPWPLSNVGYNNWTSTVYTGIAALIFVLEAISLWNLLHETERRDKFRNLCLLCLSAVSIFSTDRKSVV